MNIVDRVSKNPVPFAIAAAVVVGVAYFFGSKLIGALGGLFTGNNALTKGTAYEGAGAVGTLGAATDAVFGGALASVGSSVSETLYNWINPDVGGETVFYVVTFPDGARHSVGSSAVDKQGYFTYGGKRYRIYVNSTGQKYARAA